MPRKVRSPAAAAAVVSRLLPGVAVAAAVAWVVGAVGSSLLTPLLPPSERLSGKRY
jgi:hypothetical protein